MTEPVFGSLAGAGFRFECDAPDLAAFARQHLQPLLVGEATPAVRTTLRWHDGQPQADRLRRSAEQAGMERVDRDLYVDAGELRWFRVDDLRDLFLRVRWNGECLDVEGDFYYRLGNSPLSDGIRRLRQWKNRDRMRERRFPTLLAYMIYYPCWFWLERSRGLHPIHAAGVNIGDACVLLAGASGVGKSTLSVALALSAGARLLSDSFVLHRETMVLPVREPILLDDFSRNWLGTAAAELRALGRRYGLQRAGYHLAADRLAENGEASLLLFPRRASEAYARRISADLAHRRISSGDLMINDLRRYWAFAAVLEQLVPSGLMAERETQIAALVRKLPCYEFGVTASTSSSAATGAVLDLLHNRPLRMAGTGS